MNRIQQFAAKLPNKAILDNKQTAEVIGGMRFFVSKENPFVGYIVAAYEYLGAEVEEMQDSWCIDW